MAKTISETTCRRLDIQGFENVSKDVLAQTTPWLRLAFQLVAVLAAIGTITASTTVLWILVPIGILGAVLPVHPFDLVYNYGIRYITRTPLLPGRGAPTRFASGLAGIFALGTILAFDNGNWILGYMIGGTLTVVATLVSTTDICIPSFIYRSVFGFPKLRT